LEEKAHNYKIMKVDSEKKEFKFLYKLLTVTRLGSKSIAKTINN